MAETNKQDGKHKFHLHLVSDATGTTLLGLARACLAQFEDIEPVQKFWPLVRTQRQLDRIIAKIEENPGPVVFTMVDRKMRKRLQERCDELNVPCVAVLDPIIRSLSSYLGLHAMGVPGLQHTMDDAYFRRVAAVDFAMRHDDGKKLSDLNEAEVILVGVSRTSKTPTSVFLARRGIKAANIPLVPGVDVPPEKFELKGPFYVGLTASPDRLLEIRRTRLKAEDNKERFEENTYLDFERIKEEVRVGRRLFAKYGWPVIDVTKRSIEETSAEILALYQSHQEQNNGR
ncbi:MAG: kinase/pyrophosphorylase [Alphaproteobacteria bacterium]|nr:kinase/pyrophosphorylase [Alphaproteobacteria bacterium]